MFTCVFRMTILSGQKIVGAPTCFSGDMGEGGTFNDIFDVLRDLGTASPTLPPAATMHMAVVNLWAHIKEKKKKNFRCVCSTVISFRTSSSAGEIPSVILKSSLYPGNIAWSLIYNVIW
jgi:hypothetical protein